jgi:hypothetical protein
VSVFDAGGSSLSFSTYLGGTTYDSAKAIAVRYGRVYVAGSSQSSDYPTVDPLQPYQGGPDVVLSKLDPVRSRLLYSTHFGGSDQDTTSELVVDENGIAYLVGTTFSADFPTLNGFQATFGGGEYDAFLIRLDLDEAIFGDGFESGDTDAWSDVVP